MWIRSSLCESGACVEVEVNWLRSSFCESAGCVEVEADWVRSSTSAANGNCLEAQRFASVDVVRIRDSKDPDGPALTFTSAEWAAFVAGARAGEFDL